ncbi:MAG: putative nicotinate-nucleotide adenylyltransferase [Candidatus Izimaplasma bacterium HR2]|nr:MAG: putative nicotinate-nucleotide adenylyltransferase [Candidatus Izimaplasma bacterium HR2]
MKIVFGGAFNPVTNAHIEVYKYVISKMEADTFIFLPVSNAYTKSELVSNHHRKNMLELATKKYDSISICDLELEDSDYLGTYQSLIRLSDKYNCDIAFVVGADNLLMMRKWINIEGILSEFKIIVLGRNGIDINKVIKQDIILKKHINSFIIYKDFKLDISSTNFRETFNKELVNSEVFDYIVKNKLYRGE